ncbi:DUF2626 domain-containing protein [Alkalicoccobacillus gibsonii]|uniref:DUF2626 domain-containing protein n=1 Tax=Alkalicoccobacillus gibsonii TaxID=79881 RepID=A0ABU9VJN7_9BACI|nr:DUF2626 domain-containing protein [Alkalicoccobacillus gibsonii]MBM0067697.1 DUF2626 domain-containing protein [Alkalicoccobacillus gibsonii]
MERMYRVLAFWTGIFAVLFFAGDMHSMALLFFAQTAILLALSYLYLSERVYIYIFGAYLTIFFVGFTYYSTFVLVPSFGGHH